MISSKKIERDVLIICTKLEELLQLTKRIPPKGFMYDQSDSFALMALSFLAKQREHASSVLCLINGGHYRDAGLVVRSMNEGLVLLKWAAQDLEDRPLRWAAFAWVRDWRLMHRKLKDRSHVDPEDRQKIEDAMERIGDLFLTKKNLHRRTRGETLPPDPYHRNWLCGVTYADAFSEVRAQLLLESVYSPLSAWHHWESEGIISAITRHADRITYSPPSMRDAAASLVPAFQFLFEVAQGVDGYFNLGFAERFEELKLSFCESLGFGNAVGLVNECAQPDDITS